MPTTLRRSFFLLWFVPLFLFGQGSQLPKYTVATLPSASSQPTYTVQVLDGANDQDCVTGHGTKNVLCKSNGTAWVPVSPFQSLTTLGSGPASLNLGVLNVPPNFTSFRHDGSNLTGAFSGSPQIYDYDESTPALTAGYVTGVGHFDTTTGKWNVQVPSSTSAPTQIIPVPPDSNQGIFVPFTVCEKVPDNVSLLIAQTCTADSGYQQTGQGGIFNHNAHPSIIFSVPDPALLTRIGLGNITSVYVMAWDRAGGTMSYTLSCSGTGQGSTLVPWSVPAGSQTISSVLSGLTGANVPTAVCVMNQSQAPLGDYGNTQMYQSGLWIEYTGSPVVPTNYQYVSYPLVYSADGNTLTVSQFFPDSLFPRLFANLPDSDKWQFNQAGYPTFVVSDNDTVTIGAACHGTGVAATTPPYSLCQMSGNGNYLYAGTFGGSGPPAVSSVTSPLSSLNVPLSAGAVTVDINYAHGGSWTGRPEFRAGIELGTGTSPLNLNGSDGSINEPLCSGGGGATPHWGGCGGGTVGPGTANFIPLFATTTTVGNSHLDDGATTAGHVTITEPTDINDGTGNAGAATFVYGTSGGAASGGVKVQGPTTGTPYRVTLPGSQPPDSSHEVLTCTNADPAVCSWGAGGGSGPTLQTNGTPNGSQSLLNLAAGSNVTLTDNGTGTVTVAASGGGGSYTNLTGSASQTTVALINTACGSGTLYATTPLSIATGGTVSCPVQFSKAGLWTIASGQTVTFTYPVTKTDAPTQIFAGSGSVVLAAQDAPAAWFGAVGDGVYSAGTGTDNAAAFQKTIDSLTVGNMILACATYKSASVVNVHARNNVGIKGCQTNSKGNTTGTVIFTTSASATIFDFAGTGVTQLTYMYHNYISDLDLKRTIQPTGTATNLSLSFMCGAFVNRVFSEDAVRGFYLKGFGNCGVGEINDSNAQIGFGSFTPNASVSYYGFYVDSTGGVPFASTILTRPGVGVGTTTGSPTIYGVYVTGSLISDLMVHGLQTESTGYGIYVDGSGGAGGFHESDIHFKDSILDNCTTACIFVTGTLATNEATLEFGGGWAESSTGAYGIDIESSTGVAIHDMQIMPNGGMTTAGILLHSSQLISVSNNHFFGGWAGFRNQSSSLIIDGTTGSTVTGNSFQINPSGAVTNVILKNTSINNAFSGNWIGGGTSSVTGISADATSSNNSFLNTNAIDTTYTTKISDLGTNNQLVVSGATTNALTMNNGGSGAASGTTFDGSVARTISYNTIGAQQALTLTTTGSSGAATLSSGTLNIPQYVAGGSTSPSVTFNVATGVTASPAAPYLIAVASGTITHNCSFTTLTSDISTDLSFNVKFNGTTVLASVPATVTHGTSAGTISTFSLVGGTVTITAGQKWELDITGGTTSWTGAVQCY